MSLRRLFLLASMSILLGWTVSTAIAQEAGEVKVRTRLVADTVAAEPGATFWVGVQFEIEDGWHIYWRNPGGAGLATAVNFELPDGFVAGPLRWPLPISFEQSDGIPGFGYEGSVVLASEVTVPENFDRSRPPQIRAEVSWLACKGVCVLGSAELERSLAKLPADPVFGEWSRGLPRTFDESEAPFALTATGGLAQGTVTHWLRWREPPQSVEWFPDPSGTLEVDNVRVRTRGGLTRIDATVRRRKGAEGLTDDLSSLVVVTGEDGDRRGWELRMDLTNKKG